MNITVIITALVYHCYVHKGISRLCTLDQHRLQPPTTNTYWLHLIGQTPPRAVCSRVYNRTWQLIWKCSIYYENSSQKCDSEDISI